MGFSFVFYSASGLTPFIFLLLSIAWGALTAFFINHRRVQLTLAVSFPLLVLYLFKYLGFTFGTFQADQQTRDFFYIILSVSLPAGISFYTFQIVAYSIDVFDGKIQPEKNIVKFSAFISSFPQLIAGPILRYEQMKDQLDRVSKDVHLNLRLGEAIKLISIGLFAKIFAADVPRMIHDTAVTAESINSIDQLFGAFTYSFIIYYDFWAYSIIAIGLGLLFGLELPRNFREPYLSPNPKEFWRRWHVTLSFWLRDYVYIRLGGNRSFARNIVIVFLVIGLWHGAGWNFVVWGAYHAILVVGYHLCRDFWDRCPNGMQVAVNFVLVTMGWPLFYLPLDQYVDLISSIASMDFQTPPVYSIFPWIYIFAIGLWTFVAREDRWLFNEKPIPIFDSPFTHALLAFGAVLFFSFGRNFIYFQF